MDKYDPLTAPSPEQWLALDDSERIHLVLDDATPVRRTAQRLFVEGLDRHEVIHAIASALAGHIHGVMPGLVSGVDPSETYFAALEELTAESWLDYG